MVWASVWASRDTGRCMADQSQVARPFRRGWVRKDDKLLMFEDDRLLVLRDWPNVRAWVKRPGGPFVGHRPAEALLSRIGTAIHPRFVQRALSAFARAQGQGSPTAKREDVARIRAGLSAKQRSARSFIESFPPEVWARAAAVEQRQWHLLALLARVPGADELASDNLALAFGVASCWVFADPMTQPYRAARRMVRRRRVEIAEWLGFPARPAVVRVLGKVRAGAISVQRLFYLRETLRSESAPKALLHLPVLDRGTLRILTDPALQPLATHSLLEEVATDSSASEQLAYTLRDTQTMAAELRVRLSVVRSVRELRALHDELARHLNRSEFDDSSTMPFPPPPFDGTDDIVPLESASEIAAEGREMHHCVRTYVPLVAEGRVYVYRVLAPERATLGLRLTREGWAIEQVKGPCNARVRLETLEHLHEWLTARLAVDEAERLAAEGYQPTEVHF